MSKPIPADTFTGDDTRLIECIESLIFLNDAGKMAPHGIGSHARQLLIAAAHRLNRRPTPESQGDAVAWRYRFSYADRLGAGWLGWHYSEEEPKKYRDTINCQIQTLYTRPQPGEGGGEVSDEMVRRALDAQPWAKTNNSYRVWQCIDADKTTAFELMRAALTAALAKGGQGGSQ